MPAYFDKYNGSSTCRGITTEGRHSFNGVAPSARNVGSASSALLKNGAVARRARFAIRRGEEALSWHVAKCTTALHRQRAKKPYSSRIYAKSGSLSAHVTYKSASSGAKLRLGTAYRRQALSRMRKMGSHKGPAMQLRILKIMKSRR